MNTLLKISFIILCVLAPIGALTACAVSYWKRECLKHRAAWRAEMCSQLRQDLRPCLDETRRAVITDSQMFEEPQASRRAASLRESVQAKTMFKEEGL